MFFPSIFIYTYEGKMFKKSIFDYILEVIGGINMAWNQVSLDLCAPNRTQVRYFDNGATVLRAEKISENPKDIVHCKAIYIYLKTEKFDFVQETNFGAIYSRGQVKTPFGIEKEIETQIFTEGEELESVYVRFTLCRNSPKRLKEWSHFLTDICGIFKLQIFGGDGKIWTKEDSQNAIKNHFNWKDFSQNYDWE